MKLSSFGYGLSHNNETRAHALQNAAHAYGVDIVFERLLEIKTEIPKILYKSLRHAKGLQKYNEKIAYIRVCMEIVEDDLNSMRSKKMQDKLVLYPILE